MEVHFTPELQAKLDRAASDTHTASADYVQQLVEHYLDHDVWFRQKGKAGLDQEFLAHEDVGARLHKLLQP
jgi:predicted transcriptional regulator